MTIRPIDETDLHAFVDGELEETRSRLVESHLRAHPDQSALVDGWRRQNAALRACFDHHWEESAALRAATGQGPIETGATHWGRPSGSRGAIRKFDDVGKARRKQAALALGFVVALVMAAAIGAGAGGLLAPPRQGPSLIAGQGFVGRAQTTYLTFALDERAIEIAADKKGELLAWMRRRAGFGFAPDLAGLGLRFVGGRVVPGVTAPAGFLVYEADDASRVGLYFERADPGLALMQPPRAAPILTTIEWRGSGFAFVLIGPLATEIMQSAAERAAAHAISPGAGAD